MDARTHWNGVQLQGPRAVARRVAVRVLREPLLHYFLIGAVILFAAGAWRSVHDLHRIVITPERTAELAGKYRLQFGRDPTPAELQELVADYGDEEMLYREGRALGLDRDDEIVRRRVAQKVRFLRQDLAIPAEPTEAELRRYFRDHAPTYVQPDRVSFRHLYFSPDTAGAAAAKARAEAGLARLAGGERPEAIGADAFPDRADYGLVGPTEALRLFGRSELAERLVALPAGQWSGPFRSGYGWHLVQVTERYPGGPGDFARLEETVRGDYLRDVQAQANTRAMDELRARYRIVRKDRP